MTELLAKAFARMARLPDQEQDAFARWLLDELESEGRWSRGFEISQVRLAELAHEDLEDDRGGRTEPLDLDLDRPVTSLRTRRFRESADHFA